LQGVAGSGAENALGHAAAERRAEPLALRTLHQHKKDDEQRHEHVKREEDINDDGHDEGAEYGGKGERCKMEVFVCQRSIRRAICQNTPRKQNSEMIEPHQRAALIPNDPGASWTQFLRARFVGPLSPAGRDASLAIVVQTIVQQSQEHANLRGLVEVSSRSSLPVVFEFAGVLNLQTREVSIRQTQPDKTYDGQLSENGRVMTLREAGRSKPMHLVHEETLAQLV
jgi:hypothetical protein